MLDEEPGMMTRKRLSLRLLFAPVLAVLALCTARATEVSGAIDADTTWTPAGSPYLVVDSLWVYPDVTLTIQPGVAVEFAWSCGLYVDGTLNAVGTAGSPITFTGTTATPGWWLAIYVQGDGSADLEWCQISHAGYYYRCGLQKTGSGALTLRNSTLSNNDGAGLQVYPGSSSFVSASNTFTGNSDYGVYVNTDASFSDTTSTFSGNGIDIASQAGTLTGTVTWGLSSAYSLYVEGDFTVSSGGVLAILPGTVVKFAAGGGLWVDGSLLAAGSALAPITFTDWRDDSDGGDANRDGEASAPEPGWWGGIHLLSAGDADLEWCRLSYAGSAYGVCLEKTGSGALTLSHSTLSDNAGAGLQIQPGYSSLVSASNTLSRNRTCGVYVCADVSFTDRTSTFTGNGTDVTLQGGTLTGSVTWALNPAYSLYLENDIAVGQGAVLTVLPGTVVKFAPATGLWVYGELQATGTAAAPITFTDWRDDSDGGDANHDGDATAPGPGGWAGVGLADAGSALLDYCHLRYAVCGVYGTGSGTLTIRDSTIAHADGYGVYASGSTGTTTIENCLLTGNTLSGLRIYDSPVNALGCTFANNGEFGLLHKASYPFVYMGHTFTGNAKASVGLDGGTLSTDSVWASGGGDPFTLVLRGDVGVQRGVTLAVAPGVTVKVDSGFCISVDGTLNAVGTADEPITFTGTTPTPGWWEYIVVSGAARLEWCRVSAAGSRHAVAGLWAMRNSALTLENSTLSDIEGPALRLAQGGCVLESAGNLFSHCTEAVWVEIGASFDDTTSEFADNDTDVYVAPGDITQAVTFGLKPDYSLYLGGYYGVGVGASLTFRPGTVVKFHPGGSIVVDGTLTALGTPAAPIHFTGWRDDSVGGDANHDGNSTLPAPGWWSCLSCRGTGTLSLDRCTLAYGGLIPYPCLEKTGIGNLALVNTTIRDSAGDGLHLDGSTGTHTVHRCTFRDNPIGVRVLNQTAPETFTACRFAGNANYGVLNEGALDVDARQCWWGHASGPLHPELNPDGLGDTISDRVLFEPWLRSAAFAAIIAPVVSGTVMQGDALRFLGCPAVQAPGDAYVWDLGDDRTAGVLSPGLVTFPSTGEKHLSLGVIRGGVADPCPDTRTITVVPAAPAPDLRVTRLSVPAALRLGMPVTVEYAVDNAGAAATPPGPWTDALYLSNDAFLDAMDTPLASATVAGPVPIGGSYSGTFYPRINVASEGPAYLILVVDERWEVMDPCRLNGEQAAQADLGVPLLPSGTPVNGQFADETDTTHYYRVDVASGMNLRLAFSGPVRIYLCSGTFPTLRSHDYTASSLDEGSITVPSAYAGSAYVLVVPEGGGCDRRVYAAG